MRPLSFPRPNGAQRLKGDAEKAVKLIKGVQSVINQIEVLPQAVAPIHIIVKNGNVTLVGTVTTSPDKSQFFTAASAVAGVVSATDHIQVVP